MLQRLRMLPLAAFVLLIEPLSALAQTQQQDAPQRQWYGPGPWHMWGDGYGPFFWGGPFLMMLFWVVLIGGIIWLLVRGTHRHGPPPWADRGWGDPSHSALQILNERFARGEIQKDEYEEKKAALQSGTRR